MESESLLRLDGDRRAEDRSRLDAVDLPQREEKTELLPRRDAEDRRSRVGGVKVRHRRQVLQDMARPLKHWLYRHRDNPYPTKTQKVLLALGSHMTLVQVSNWFANARRRLKNTVRQPDLSWALRIQLYNQCIVGNAERLSVCSDDASDDGGRPQTPVAQDGFRSSAHRNRLQSQSGVIATADSAHSDDSASPPSKYKSSLLHRYLNDTLRHVMVEGVASAHGGRRHFQPFGSSEDDQEVVSLPPETEANGVFRTGQMDDPPAERHREQQQSRGGRSQGWKEIHAAVALTHLAQGQGDAPQGWPQGPSRSRGPPWP
ncbi:homeobox protein Mohawk-like isoform X2 [Antennarius striatus]|uniref:homeobox protein Mohawk-like isoform X2 n=1 Tax=Antennarius striatus TaxID=241820 RepID=UPI0035B43C8A